MSNPSTHPPASSSAARVLPLRPRRPFPDTPAGRAGWEREIRRMLAIRAQWRPQGPR
jgi:hypothetical protein